MILSFLRLLRGYVEFEAQGRFPERFINLLNRRGVAYWNMLPQKTGCRGNLFVKDYLKIRPTARKAEVRLRVKKRRGLPFFLRKYRARRGVAVGAVLAALVLAFLSGFIWDIKVDGLNTISQSRFDSVLRECGLYSGALKGSVDTDAVERKLMLRIPEIRWVSVNALNNICQIQIKEKAARPKKKTASYPCNIRAERDGIITKTVVYSGAKVIESGSAVKKDQLLVSAVVENAENRLSYVHSSADIYADIFLSKKIILKKNQYILIPKENYTQKSNLNFMWFTLPFKLSASDSTLYCDNYYKNVVCFNDVSLPISESICRRFYFEREKFTPDQKTAKEILKKRLLLYECFSRENCVIKSRRERFLESDDGFALKADYVMNKNIAVRQRIRVEQ